MTMSKYYVYTLAYPDGTVFYVGKGSGDRVNQHEIDAQKGVVSARCDIIRAIWERGEEVTKVKVIENLDEREAYRREAALIKEYGLEALANQVTGTTGVPRSGTNLSLSVKRRERLRAAMIALNGGGWPSDEEVAEKFRELAYGGVDAYIARAERDNEEAMQS